MSIPTNKYFILYASCIPVKGHKRSVLCDLQRDDFVFIPNDLYGILTEHRTKSVDELKLYYNNGCNTEIDEYFDFLLKNEYGFWNDNLEEFPLLDLYWDRPSVITNAIIDVDESSDHDYNSIFAQLEKLGCGDIQLRFYDSVELRELERILTHLESRRIKSVEMIIKDSAELTNELLIGLCNSFGRLFMIYVHSCAEDKLIYKGLEGIGRIVGMTQKIDNNSHCGVISPIFFSISLDTFTEAQKHNSCLNRKISIDINGDIKNCPTFERNYGNVRQTSLQSVVSQREFKALWDVNRDLIEICKDCEFRYICTDCRAFSVNAGTPYSKPVKCNYNPYTAVWE